MTLMSFLKWTGCSCMELVSTAKIRKFSFMMEGETVIFEGEKSRSLPRVISALQALRSVRKGCQASLASVVDTSEATLSLSDVKTVQEF